MQQGFGATQEAAPRQNEGDPLLAGTGIFHISNEEGKNRRTVCLIDDSPMWGYRHLIKRPYVPGVPSNDWRERGIRVTCAVAQDPQDHPKECLICEAAIRASDIIKRRFTANLTLIDEGEHRTKKGAVYHDLKKMLELDWSYYNGFNEQKKAIPGGTLAGMRFSVLRPTGDAKQSKTFGNVWTPLGIVNPMQHFWNSPAVRAIGEMAAKRNERLTQQDAVARLVARIDYAKELENYTPQIAERFIMRALAKSYTASQDQGAPPNGGGFYQPGAGNPIGAPTMPAHAAPNYAPAPMGPPMGGPPPGYAPQQQPQWDPNAAPSPFQGAPPQGAPMGFPQAPQPAPMPVGNPMGATMPSPQMPTGQPQWPAPQPQPQPQYAPQTQGGPQPQFPQGPTPQPQPQGPAGGGYGFEQAPGWSPQFPGAPAGPQPRQPQMQGQPMGAPPSGYPQMQAPPQGQPQPQGPQPGQRIPPPPAGARPF